MHTASFLSSLILSAASFRGTLALPTPEELAVQACPEVIPGPGLPSLESLNLTSADLCAMGLPDLPDDEMSAMFDPRCGPSEAAYGNVNEIIACFHYLNNLGTTMCGVGGNFQVVEMCRAGNSHVQGQSMTGGPSASYCMHVANAVLWTIDHCTRPDQSVAGFAAAYGNGDLVIGSTNVVW